MIFEMQKKALLRSFGLAELPEFLKKTFSFGVGPSELEPPADAYKAPPFGNSLWERVYDANLPPELSVFLSRPLTNFDFEKEWNNLGFGNLETDLEEFRRNIFLPTDAKCIPLSSLVEKGEYKGIDCALMEGSNNVIFWHGRPAGLIDTDEILIFEKFFCNYKCEEYGAIPRILDIPFGYDFCSTMRLDCDEDIESSHQLFEMYRHEKVPFSLAITTQILESSSRKYLEDVVEWGGSIMSHSVTHPENWGANYEEALWQARESKKIIEAIFGSQYKVEYAVSPFHKNPTYAVQALRDAGYQGFVGGVANSSPEYLLGRSGVVPFVDGIVGHSQQCMLHGDCLLKNGDPLRVYKQAIDRYKRSQRLFGFLDHPFSARYSYGWKSEGDRIDAHLELIDYIRSQGKVVFLNEKAALDFVRKKSSLKWIVEGNRLKASLDETLSDLPVGIEYKSQTMEVRDGDTIQY
ncbi:MAG: polysaccharide deacetylase family protein [Bdellovibrionales bacterium]